MKVSRHAVKRYIQRYQDFNPGQVEPSKEVAREVIKRIAENEPVDIIPPNWFRSGRPANRGERFIHLDNYCLVVIDNTVVTVLTKNGAYKKLKAKGAKKVKL
jgi:hypothetical protein